MTVTITPLVASLLALLYLVLSVRVIAARGMARVSLGDGGNAFLLRRMRVHGNFIEYAPLALLLMLMLELMGGAHWLLCGLGVSLLIGRSIHAYGVSSEPEPANFRVAGVAITLTVILSTALANLVLAAHAILSGTAES